MRSCIYCGRELAPGEVCSCPQSIAHRNAKQTEQSGTDSVNTDKDGKETKKKDKKEKKEKKHFGREKSYAKTNHEYNADNAGYRTGYTQKESAFKHSYYRAKAKRAAKRNSIDSKNFFRNLWQTFVSSLRSPTDSVINPPDMSWPMMLVIWAIQGALIWLCVFFIITNISRGPFSILASMLALKGMAGYRNIMYMLLSMVSGAIGGIVMLYLYTGVFYLVNRFVFRIRTTPYKSFCQRLALTTIPFALTAVIGTALSMISSTTLLILLLTGAVSWVILTYEALKTEWISFTRGRVLYGIMIGFFALFTFICYFIRISG